MRRLGIRSRLLVLVVATVAAALTALIVAFNLVLANTLTANARSLVRARATAEVGLLRPGAGGVVLGEAPDGSAPDADVWVFSGQRALEAPRASKQARAAARGLAAGPARFVTVSETDSLLYAAPVVFSGRRLGTVVAGASLAPYEETQRTALIGSLALGFAMLVLVTLAARWLLASSLRPVHRMTRQAEAWSEHDLDHRFGLGEPYDELTELAATLDGLLDRLAASLRREQRFSAELSHELRTPLARLIASTELALRRERTPHEYRAALEDVRRAAGTLTRTVDALVAAARLDAGAPRGTSDAQAVAAQAVEACAGLAGERGVDLAVEPPAHPIRVGIESDLAERILQPLVENACRYGRSLVRVSMRRGSGGVLFDVGDDGPGVDAAERERIFEPGVRGRGATGDGAGLGLALARRLARSAAGDVEAADGRFVVRLPAA